MRGPGVAGYGLYLPEGRASARAIAHQFRIPESVVRDKQGLLSKRVSAPHEMPSAMALSAARRALARAHDAGVDRADIGLVAWVGSQWKDYHVWLASAFLQHRLGLRGSFAFDLSSMCTGMVFGLAMAKRFLLADDDLRAVLLVGASKESYLVRPSDPRSRWMDNFADGGVAVVVARDHARHRILGSDFLSDGSLALAVVQRGGGARFPTSTSYARAGRAYLENLLNEGRFRRQIDAVSLPNFERVIRRSVERSALPMSRVRLLVLNHMKWSFHRSILEKVGIPEERSVYLREYGHLQSADQFVGLDVALRAGTFSRGPVVMAAAGAGYVWGSTVLSWG
ncbi:MAG: 3-oxoacyl-ACP synthase [Thermoplasmata archaeon]|nr:3-oxoacyl-ACP synthase [Thermoplasmata archaeon]